MINHGGWALRKRQELASAPKSYGRSTDAATPANPHEFSRLGRCDTRFAQAWWHWFFYGQRDKPERAILADPATWYGGSPDVMGAEAYADYRAAIYDPETIQGMMEDYRAGLGIDRDHDEADRRAGRTLACPTLALWSLRDDLEALYSDVLSVWRPWAPDLRGRGLDCGHHMAEEAPEELAQEFLTFLATESGRRVDSPDRRRQ